MENYIEQAHRTLSDKFYGEKVSLKEFIKTAEGIIKLCEKLDTIKRALYYGKSDPYLFPLSNQKTMERFPYTISGDKQVGINILHAVIGKTTEVGELLEALISEEAFDKVNAVEEVGDGFWYDAILLKAISSSFDEAQTININKLKARFPDKFSEKDALNRDLEKERVILEDSNV